MDVAAFVISLAAFVLAVVCFIWLIALAVQANKAKKTKQPAKPDSGRHRT